MLNDKEFIDRLQKILEEYDLTASAFAEKIDVGRSSISHILSGRNKPSLEFIMKINMVFPEIDLYWLLKGTPQEQNRSMAPELFSGSLSLPSSKALSTERKVESQPKPEGADKKEIERVIILYKDGRFKDYDSF